MSKRINELADQALKACDAAKERGIEQYSKRIAELIVQDILESALYGDEFEQAKDSIKQYFGVNE